ncbi:hypothetical protein RKD20_008946 [Streptomyces sp. SLBN-8D4]
MIRRVRSSRASRVVRRDEAGVCVMSFTFPAVVMRWSGVPFPSQIGWCLLPVSRRSTGDRPLAAPLSCADVGAVHACVATTAAGILTRDVGGPASTEDVTKALTDALDALTV